MGNITLWYPGFMVPGHKNTVVQACLATIKVEMKPLYKGRIDGECGKDLIDAICAFQAAEQIKPSGKIIPADQTLSRLKLRTPSTVKVHALPMGSTTRPGDTSKARELAKRATEAIKTSMLPQDQAAALAKVIIAASEEGIPLALKRVSITEGGRFAVELCIERLPPHADASLTQAIARNVSEKMSRTALWSVGSPNTLKFVTHKSFSDLKVSAKPSKETRDNLGTAVNQLDQQQQAVVAAIEKIAKSGVTL